MAADGGWPARETQALERPPFRVDSAQLKVAVSSLGTRLDRLERSDARRAAELREWVAALEYRLARTPDRVNVTLSQELGDVLERLVLRVETLEAFAEGRAEGVSARLNALETAVDQRLRQQADDFAQVLGRLQAQVQARIAMIDARARTTTSSVALPQIRTDQGAPGATRLVLAASTVAAALSVTAAAILVASAGSTPAPPAPRPFLEARMRGSAPAAAPGWSFGDESPAAFSAAARRTATQDSDQMTSVLRDLEQGAPHALARLTGLAQAGEPVAQLHLAGLYAEGAGGLARDLSQARFWNEQAAQAGERIAMYNLGLHLANGEGGPVDLPQAARWFRRAAELGVVDAAYNLGLLLEAGKGVDRNFSEAYRWFSIAANAGDALSRGKALELETRLTAKERASLDAAVRAFQPGVPIGQSPVIPPAGSVAESQTLLARAGYYIGPSDGVVSDAYLKAARAYGRERRSPTAPPSQN